MPLNSAFIDAYDRLVDAWRRHYDLHHQGASISDLASSRRRLDGARLDAALSRCTVCAA